MNAFPTIDSVARYVATCVVHYHPDQCHRKYNIENIDIIMNSIFFPDASMLSFASCCEQVQYGTLRHKVESVHYEMSNAA